MQFAQKPTKIHVFKALLKMRIDDAYLEYLDRPDTTELRFLVTPYDLLHNLIESKRAIQNLKLRQFGYSGDEGYDIVRVSLKLALAVSINSLCLNIDSPFQKDIRHHLYYPRYETYLPFSRMAFPILTEELPVWVLFATFGHIMAHEIMIIIRRATLEIASRVRPIELRKVQWYWTHYTVSLRS